MTVATGTTVLKTAIATYAHTKGLKDGTVTAPGIRLEHIEVSPIVGAFRRMVRTLEFDVSEMAITTYLTARAHGKAFTALPVFVMRQFHHAPIVYNVRSGVKSPKDLEGKKVGVRAYTVTTGVWFRSSRSRRTCWSGRARILVRCWPRASSRRPSALVRSTLPTSSR